MVKKYINFISEKLGVPEGNIESAQLIYDELINFIKSKGDTFISDTKLSWNSMFDENNINFKIKSVFNIGDLKINSVLMSITTYEHKSNEIIGLSVAIPHHGVNYNSFKYDKSKSQNIGITIKLAIKPNSKFSDLLEIIISEKNRYVGVLSHELKHVYDKLMIGKEMFGDACSYQSWTNTRFGIDAIDEFILRSKKAFKKLKEWDGFVGDIPDDLKASIKREAKLNSILGN